MDKETKKELENQIMEVIKQYSCAKLEYLILSLSNNSFARVVDIYSFINELIENKTLHLVSGRSSKSNNLSLYLVKYDKEKQKKS